MKLLASYPYDLSVIVVSFNTRDLLRECLDSLFVECSRLPETMTTEILVVDNASRDGSAEMVANEFVRATQSPGSRFAVRLINSDVNLGFGAANNVALEQARGRYIVLLNSDAFFHSGALRLAVEHMDANPTTGVGGARLVSRDGALQPSARCFPSILSDAMVSTGLSHRFPRSHIFGAPDRTWADPNQPAEVDWVPGAFSILRREALMKAGTFDPVFFLYLEEVDLCRRIKAAGYCVSYWPDVVVTHVGGESSRQLRSLIFSRTASQVVAWRMRSTLLYYRKHHGEKARLAYWLELGLYGIRYMRNRGSSDPARQGRAQESKITANLMRQAWRETQGGRVSPPRPW
jgi:GT2 family glycosyltransferase